jgi:hypothetical protein
VVNWIVVRGVIVGYSKYPKPPNVRIIRGTLKNSKATSRVEYNFFSFFISFLNIPIYRLTKLELRKV